MTNRYNVPISQKSNPNGFKFLSGLLRSGKMLWEKVIDIERALKLAQKVVELKPTAQTFDLLALLYLKRGMYEEAEKAIQKALELAPGDRSILPHRGDIRKRMTR